MSNSQLRDDLISYVEREFIGPDPINIDGFIQKNGEEILVGDPPRIRYSAGILYPPKKPLANIDDVGNLDVDESTFDLDKTDIESKPIKSTADDISDNTDEILNLSNSFSQSSMSLTVSVDMADKISIEINSATYTTISITSSENGKSTQKHLRKPLFWNNDNNQLRLPSENERLFDLPISIEGKETGLKLVIVHRYTIESDNIYTFSLMNNKHIVTSIKDEDCFFQSKFKLISKNGFKPLPDDKKTFIDDDDYQSNKLLYRNVHKYAVGHGCAAEWDMSKSCVESISTSIFPKYELKPIVPNILPGIELNMKDFSNLSLIDSTVSILEEMAKQYLEWIHKQEIESLSLSEEYKATAIRHIRNCLNCHERMIEGIECLRNDINIRISFAFMNEAMLLQQIHFRLPLNKWIYSDNDLKLEHSFTMPNINEMESWYNPDGQDVYGKWRPFQIAFILLNLKQMLDKSDSSRGIVDLIWFPTGGGKTEAYLGLSAFVIFYRKLTNQNDEGTSVIMRYTLRLLTAQQYERASSLICACEIIRRNNSNVLGKNRITAGLWVGEDTTPNKMSSGENSAVKVFQDLYSGVRDENPFILLKCPWCGAQMGVIEHKSKKTRSLPGYAVRKVNGSHVFFFQCKNEICDFSSNDFRLPLTVIDEEIYENPPTLIIGTVDKFAMLPYLPKAQRIFGFRNGERISCPDLIIQDELHLISGPLGSTVGLYETMINELCTDRRNNSVIRPKIIASTATISRAKEQCHAIFNCGTDNVNQFPPSGLDAGNSFFAEEDKNGIGRKYVGIYATSTSSFAMTNIRLYSTLLYAANALSVENKAHRDPYWTNLGYFNSLRELGQTATWINADIDEYLHTIYKRKYEDKNPEYKNERRYIWRYEELTSRISGDKIPASLQNLGIKYTGDNRDFGRPVDICLATNMVSVGLDLPRLGLMTVTGQPKTTAEYIQATSRVGRSKNAPGVVFIVYNPSRPRDRSHYEQFPFYHSRIYSYVEPTSVTPFASPLRARALHAIIIGLIRLQQKEAFFENPDIFTQNDLIKKVQEVILTRVSSIDAEELMDTQSDILEVLNLWKARRPKKYQDFRSKEDEPLMYPPGIIPNIAWDDRGFKTPTSMRNVDSACEVKILSKPYTTEEEI